MLRIPHTHIHKPKRVNASARIYQQKNHKIVRLQTKYGEINRTIVSFNLRAKWDTREKNFGEVFLGDLEFVRGTQRREHSWY